MRRALVATMMIGLLGAAAPAAADVVAGTGAGAFQLTEDDQGHRYRFMGQLLGTAWDDRLRIGGEIELGKYETELAGLPGIQVKSYNLRGVIQYVPWPTQFSPYIGAGLGVNVVRLDEDQVKSLISTMEVDNFGISMGGVGFVGFQMPVTQHFSVFTEGRVGGVFQVVDESSVEMGAGSLDGYGAMAGVRMRF